MLGTFFFLLYDVVEIQLFDIILEESADISFLFGYFNAIVFRTTGQVFHNLQLDEPPTLGWTTEPSTLP